jgi:hypothetical protein
LLPEDGSVNGAWHDAVTQSWQQGILGFLGRTQQLLSQLAIAETRSLLRLPYVQSAMLQPASPAPWPRVPTTSLSQGASPAVHLHGQSLPAAWRLKAMADPLIVCTHAQTPEAILAPKVISPDDLKRCEELGAALAAGMSIGVF